MVRKAGVSTACLRDTKGSVFDGGIRAPCLVRWPGHFPAGAKVERTAAHIDLAPTLLAAAGVAAPANVKFDGISLLGDLRGEAPASPDRLLFFQWHRGDEPVRTSGLRGARTALQAGAAGGSRRPAANQTDWALFDMTADPGEQRNLIDEQPAIAAEMKAAYDRWFDDVSATRGYPVPRIIAGTRHENPLTLTRQDWRGPRAGWGAEGLGHWDVEIAAAAPFDVTVRIPATDRDRAVRLSIGDQEHRLSLPAGAGRATFADLKLPPGTNRAVEAVVIDGDRQVGAHYVDLDCRDAGRGARVFLGAALWCPTSLGNRADGGQGEQVENERAGLRIGEKKSVDDLGVNKLAVGVRAQIRGPVWMESQAPRVEAKGIALNRNPGQQLLAAVERDGTRVCGCDRVRPQSRQVIRSGKLKLAGVVAVEQRAGADDVDCSNDRRWANPAVDDHGQVQPANGIISLDEDIERLRVDDIHDMIANIDHRRACGGRRAPGNQDPRQRPGK